METRVVVFSGISGSGKSTLGNMLKAYLSERGREVALLDGDSLREFFDGSLQYSSEERLMVSKILTYAASLLAAHGTDVILATMLSQPGARQFLKKRVEFVEIFCDADLDECMENDAKKVYRDSMALEKPNIVGHDLPIQHPESPDLILKPHKQPPEQSFERVIGFLEERGLFGLSRNVSS